MGNNQTQIQTRLGLKYPLLQAPMAGADSVEMAIGVARAGGLGGLACALLSENQIREKILAYKQAGKLAPLNLNFFCHKEPVVHPENETKWLKELEVVFKDLGLTLNDIKEVPVRQSFNESHLRLIKELGVRVVSFHFGLPRADLVSELKNEKVLILSSATDLEEAKWLQENGADFVIAQGSEAGGHRASFLKMDPLPVVAANELTEQIHKNLSIPVISAGGIATPEHIKSFMKLGADAVQLGSLYLFCIEAQVSKCHLQRLQNLGPDQTTLTNIFSGKPARAINNILIQKLGPISKIVPEFPRASKSMAPIRKKADENGNSEYLQMWSGERAGESWKLLQDYGMQKPSAAILTERLGKEAFGY